MLVILGLDEGRLGINDPDLKGVDGRSPGSLQAKGLLHLVHAPDVVVNDDGEAARAGRLVLLPKFGQGWWPIW